MHHLKSLKDHLKGHVEIRIPERDHGGQWAGSAARVF